MKTKPPATYASETIHGVVLHREDLERVIQSLEDRDLSVQISDSQTEYDNLDEVISQRGSQPGQLEIEGMSKTEKYGSITLSFSSHNVGLRFAGSGAPKEAWYDLGDSLRKRRSW